ncbi:MAG: quinolinate synthase [Proteobacteria bacterium SG_bin7]|nr:MAG: quinolinate synthase [Proteobacteria bacterium SG_bin7]
MYNVVEERIRELKKQRNAVVLAHYYEDSEVQDIADVVGDSLQLAQYGQKSSADVALIAGVVFMAESVKLLSPEKVVLVPDLNAGCSLVHGSPYEKYLEWRNRYPDHISVTYVNSSVEVKSITDVICTSSNAEKIINSIPIDRGILFGPDRHLGNYLTKKLGRKMEIWPGSCEVHVLFSAKKLFLLREQHPDALVLAHPECDEAILQQSDIVGSTSRIIQEVRENRAKKKFIVATEDGIFHQIRKFRPDVELIQAPAEGSCACNQCPYMKLSTLEKIKMSLETLSPEVKIDSRVMERAQLPLQRMMDITNGKSVMWPDRFENGIKAQTL